MAAYTSLQLTVPKFPVSGPGMGGRSTHHERGQFTLTANLAAGDTVELFDLPPRSRVMGGFIKSDAVDSASAVTYNVGTAATPALFFSASTVGRVGGGVDRNVTFAGTDLITTGKTRVRLTVGAAPGTPVNGGTVVVVLNYISEEPA